MAYSGEEQEFFVHFDQLTKEWTVETNIWNRIRKVEPMLKPETIVREMEDDRCISICGVLDDEKYKVSLSKRPAKRELSEEERKILQERMAKMHAARNAKLAQEQESE